MKYMIYGDIHWTRLPLQNPLIMGKWIYFEGRPEFETEDLNEALTVLKRDFADKVYRIPEGEGTEYVLYYVVNSNAELIAALDFDGNVLIDEKQKG